MGPRLRNGKSASRPTTALVCSALLLLHSHSDLATSDTIITCPEDHYLSNGQCVACPTAPTSMAEPAIDLPASSLNSNQINFIFRLPSQGNNVQVSCSSDVANTAAANVTRIAYASCVDTYLVSFPVRCCLWVFDA